MTTAIHRAANQKPDAMKNSQQFDEFRLDDASQSCLAIAYLRLTDLDIIASNSKAPTKKLSDRRIAQKEVASFLNVTKPNKIVDQIIDDTSNVRDYEKIIKAGAHAATVAVIGGLMMAPHIGTAIGLGMGISGALSAGHVSGV
jgi:hypothetical protein